MRGEGYGESCSRRNRVGGGSVDWAGADVPYTATDDQLEREGLDSTCNGVKERERRVWRAV